MALRTAPAEKVAEGLVSIFCHTGIPQKVLSDCGSVFITEWNSPLVAVKVKKPDGSVRVLRRF